MTSRLTPLLLLLTSLLTLSLSAFYPLPASTTRDHGIPTIDFARSHYDFEHCGKPTTGRARRGMGDDYVDGLDFEVRGDSGDAAVGEMPWAVAVVTRVPDRASPRLCAGTLVSRRHVLSAAHCLSKGDVIAANPGHVRCKKSDHLDLNDFSAHSVVKYGGECLTGRDSKCDQSMLTKETGIKNITLFPFFREDCSHGSDLVIIELDKDVDVPHACLSHLHDLEDASLRNATATAFHTFGWAADKSKGYEAADRLQKSSLGLLQDRCAKKWKSLSTDVLCAPPGKHIEQCLGDSGAGLLATSSGRAFLIGVLSSSSACSPSRDGGPDETRFTDVRLFSATIDLALGTRGPFLDLGEKTTVSPK